MMNQNTDTPLPDLSHIAEKLRPLAMPMERLVPDPQNARRHDARNIEAIRASLRRYGQRVPLVVNSKNNIIEKGNGTFEAATAEGWQHIAVVDVDDDPVTAAGFSLADNRSSELAEWDLDVLGVQLQALQDSDVALPELGWTAPEFEDILSEIQSDADALANGSNGSLLALAKVSVEEPHHKVEKGEVWRLGKHLLIIADVLKEWPLWAKHLTSDGGEETIFAPYPGPFVPLTLKGETHRLVMVQPDIYIAGHILDQWKAARDEPQRESEAD